MNLMQENFSAQQVPGEVVAVDETMIPFHGKLFFRQYIPKKASKYGIKMFKLCNPLGYTLQVYLFWKI